MNTLNYIRDIDGIRGENINIVIYKTTPEGVELNNMCLDIMQNYQIEYRNGELQNIEKLEQSVYDEYMKKLSVGGQSRAATIDLTAIKGQVQMLAARDWNLKKHLLTIFVMKMNLKAMLPFDLKSHQKERKIMKELFITNTDKETL